MNKQMSKAYDALKRRFAKKGEARPLPWVTFPSAPGITFRKLEADGPWVVTDNKTGQVKGTAADLYPKLEEALNRRSVSWDKGGAAP